MRHTDRSDAIAIGMEDTMLKISISVEGAFGFLDWPRWQRLITEVEALGFAGVFLADHFGIPDSPGKDSLELVTGLTYLAAHTKRVHFGSLVAPLSFRDPVLLARQAAAIDALSAGRMILGLGAGWQDAEHIMFGYALGTPTTRMDRLAEGLVVITGLLRSDTPLSYEGRFYQLREAALLGPKRASGPPILVGGRGPKRTLPLVARYADIWGGQHLTPDEYQERSSLLDTLLHEVGRQPHDVERTIALWMFCGRNEMELEARVAWVRQSYPVLAPLPLAKLFETMRSHITLFVGTPAEVVERLRAYEAVGVSEVMLQWGGMDDRAGLELLAEHVLPHFGNS
jgi:alkanesulfonate monooxygenase SsuD/methylene tetrahydromethanopterin reductase-like flavin-dependent oxidoreductase (luciferase family)